MAVEYVWMHVLDGSSLGAILLFYGAAASFVIQNEDVRHCLSVVSRRAAVLLWPRCRSAAPVHVAFVDVFFADAMCSLSKVFFDWGMIWTIAYYHPNPVPQSYGSVVFPSLGASLPYIIRARQCILCWAEGKMNNDPNRYLHLLNCLKYSTSLFPLCISAYQKTMGGTVDDQYRVERILVIFLAINAGYSFAWDVVMDWGMAQNPSCSCKGNASGEHISTIESFLRPRLRFGVYASFSILILDGILRGSWMLRFYENALFSSVDVYVFTTQFLEVFRRGIWNLLRVDWEMVKQIQKRKGKEKDMPNPKPLDPGDSDTVPLVLI
uniref:EXS domain-containing protein n=1 Tax=Corethron hystrix TaxID=216773 RepID=A0A7S1C0L3_9STRA